MVRNAMERGAPISTHESRFHSNLSENHYNDGSRSNPCRACQPTFALILCANRSDIPAYTRLRKFLKAAVRFYGLRCIDVREVAADPDHSPACGGQAPVAGVAEGEGQ